MPLLFTLFIPLVCPGHPDTSEGVLGMLLGSTSSQAVFWMSRDDMHITLQHIQIYKYNVINHIH